ncbi:four helix bundle protein [Candidatus Parcubacteria bacterium]|nr:four helix bundle protein [Candidatus Parcubacteria bacterium]
MTETRNNYDLEERTAKFGERVIDFCKKLPQDAISKPIISQLIRSATGIGANYMEANAASSKKDFKNKVFICKKEAQGSKHWLRMLARCFPPHREEIKTLWKEAQELTLIFGKIISSMNKARIQNSSIRI